MTRALKGTSYHNMGSLPTNTLQLLLIEDGAAKEPKIIFDQFLFMESSLSPASCWDQDNPDFLNKKVSRSYYTTSLIQTENKTDMILFDLFISVTS